MCDSGSSDSADNSSRSDGHTGLVALYTRRAEALFNAQEYKVCFNMLHNDWTWFCNKLKE